MENRYRSEDWAGDWRTACALFPDRMAAERGIDELLKAGVTRDNVSVVMRSREETGEIARETGTKAGTGAGTGLGIGAVVGGAAGVLAGLGLLAIPGIGPLLAVGPIIAGITGAVGGGAIGGIAGALIGAGIPEHEAREFQAGVERGGVLVSVRCNVDCDRVMGMMRDMGAQMTTCSMQDRPGGGPEPTYRNPLNP